MYTPGGAFLQVPLWLRTKQITYLTQFVHSQTSLKIGLKGVGGAGEGRLNGQRGNGSLITYGGPNQVSKDEDGEDEMNFRCRDGDFEEEEVGV